MCIILILHVDRQVTILNGRIPEVLRTIQGLRTNRLLWVIQQGNWGSF